MIAKFKNNLRSYYKEIRDTNSREKSEYCLQHKLIISKTVELITELSIPETIIGIYYPLLGEISLLSLLNLLPCYKFALPTFINKKIVYTSYNLGCSLVKSSYGLYIPTEVNTVQPRLLLIPGLLFDINRYRIGFSCGYYDQNIADNKNIEYNIESIGICFNFQLKNFVMRELHDQKMNYIVTDQMLIVCEITKHN